MDTPRSLLDRLRSSPDSLAWDQLVTLYTPWIRTILQRAGVNPSDRDDLEQEAFAVLAREMSKFDHNGRAGAFRSWLKTIVVHRLQHYRRSQQVANARIDHSQDVDALPERFGDLESYWDAEHDRHILRELMKVVEPSFSESVWRAFQRQVIDGWKAADVAQELGISVNAALLAKSRVLRRLRDEAAGIIDDV